LWTFVFCHSLSAADSNYGKEKPGATRCAEAALERTGVEKTIIAVHHMESLMRGNPHPGQVEEENLPARAWQSRYDTTGQVE